MIEICTTPRQKKKIAESFRLPPLGPLVGLDYQSRSGGIPSNLDAVPSRNSLKAKCRRRTRAWECAGDVIIDRRRTLSRGLDRHSAPIVVPIRPRKESVGFRDWPTDIEDLHPLGPRQGRRVGESQGAGHPRQRWEVI